MKKELLKIKRKFILFQMLVFLGVILIVLLIISHGYIKKAKGEIKYDLDQTASLVVDYFVNNQDIPKEDLDAHLFFIINQKDGSYVVERKDQSEQSNVLWGQYRTKLTYQMQRQKRGWIVYPDYGSWKYFRNKKIIRYLTVEELGWIIAVEEFMPSEWILLQGVVSRNVLANLAFVVFVGFLLVKVIADRQFSDIEKSISESSSSGLLDFNQAIVKKPTQEPEMKMSEEKTFEIRYRSKDHEPTNESTHKNQEMPNFKKSDQGSQIEKTQDIQKPENLEEKTDVKDEEYADQEWRVPEKGIKSPLLKKMIDELRNKD